MPVMDREFTVTDVDPMTLPSVAVIVDDPAATPFTAPDPSTVAFAIVEEPQVTSKVRSFVLPSE